MSATPIASARKKPGNRFGEDEVHAPLARGGMGGVYLAAHESTREKVALKVIDRQLASHPEVAQRLYEEARLASSASHPCLLDIREARTSSDGLPYLVMEYLDGETLGAIADRGRVELGLAVAICAQVASAVAALHAAGVMHCDLKHDNVFVLDGAWLRVKVIDFGVSRRFGEVLDDGTIAGTPWCMAFDLATGLPPFDGSLPALMTAHLEQRPARPSWLAPMPLELERLILRALAKEAEDRPTMAELAAALTALADTMQQPVAHSRCA
jgi:serine/threonine-protein kinase